MKLALSLLVASSATALAAPPTDAQFAALKLTLEVPTINICRIEREVHDSSDGLAYLRVVYADRTRVDREEAWRFHGGQSDGQSDAHEVTEYKYAGGSLAEIVDDGRLSWKLSVDARGVLSHAVNGSGEMFRYEWNVTPAKKPLAAHWPEGDVPPRQLPVTGTLTRSRLVRGKVVGTATYTYDVRGVRIDPGCTQDAKGFPTTCKVGESSPVTFTYRWKNGRLVESRTDDTKEVYEYDKRGRITRQQHWQTEKGTLAITSESRFEYRCETPIPAAWPVWPR